MTYLYVHTVPNGKRYIGITDDLEQRWKDGIGYKDNPKFYDDIRVFGWENIRHEIIDCFDDRKDAEFYEALYIVLFNTENENMGYNNTQFKETLLKKYNSKNQIKPNTKKKSKTYKEYTTEDQDVIKKFNMPWSALSLVINEWIFNERSRQILKRKFYDGISFNELAKEFNISTQRVQAIVYQCQAEIFKHI